MVSHTARLATAVHGQDGIAHIHATKRDGRGQDVAQGTAASHIAVVHKTLATPALRQISENTAADTASLAYF